MKNKVEKLINQIIDEINDWAGRLNSELFASPKHKKACFDRINLLKVRIAMLGGLNISEMVEPARITKFIVGQKVFFLSERELYYKPIAYIEVSDDGSFWYGFEGTRLMWKENELYASEKELNDAYRDRLRKLLKDELYD